MGVEPPQGCIPVPYRRRRPDKTVLYGVVQAHFETYLCQCNEGTWDGSAVPAHVEREFRRYLLLRYCARPPFALERLEAIDAHRLMYHLPKAKPNGRTELVPTPLELIQRFAVVIASHPWRDILMILRPQPGHPVRSFAVLPLPTGQRVTAHPTTTYASSPLPRGARPCSAPSVLRNPCCA